MNNQHQIRLNGREAQTHRWAPPVPEIVPRTGIHAPRVRAEWDTRDTMNNRIWSDLMMTPAKQVTSQMLVSHPTSGASPMMPTDSRTDYRVWKSGPEYFPDPASPGQRPTLPRKSLIGGAWGADYNADGALATREAAGVVKETGRYYGEDVGSRINDRTFQQQWMTPRTTAPVDVGNFLRPSHDDYRNTYRQDIQEDRTLA